MKQVIRRARLGVAAVVCVVAVLSVGVATASAGWVGPQNALLASGQVWTIPQAASGIQATGSTGKVCVALYFDAITSWNCPTSSWTATSTGGPLRHAAIKNNSSNAQWISYYYFQ